MSPCGKEWHIDIASALQRMNSIKQQSNVKRPQLLSVYECVACEGWHVGHDHQLKFSQLCIGEMR